MTQRLRHSVLILLLTIAAVSCARIIAPSGGPEDEQGPQLISSSPLTGETNFIQNTLTFTFNERVQARSLETDLIITPKPKGSFRTRINKNVITLTFFEPLEENTTYSLNFANSVQDVTNNNPVENLGISFSTGPYIDSLTVSGQILNLYTQDPVENALVSLYRLQDSLDIIKGPASYYSKTDSTGNYLFQNLPSDQFRIYSAIDKNNNSQADSDKEKYGFYPDTLVLNSSLSNIDMTLQNLDTEELRTVSARSFGSYYDISFNKAVNTFKVISLGDFVYHPFSTDKIRFYRTNTTYNDTTQLVYSVVDSLNTTLLDTANFYFSESKLAPASFSFRFEPDVTGILSFDTLQLTFSKPILTFNTDSLSFKKDSLNTVPFDASTYIWNKYNTKLSIPVSSAELFDQQYPSVVMDIKPAAFISADRDTSKGLQKTISLLKTEDTAVIFGSVNTALANVIVQLLDNRSLKVIRQTTSKSFQFEFLPAGQYQVRVISDRNANGKWDIGNILTNEMPEPAKFYFDDFYNTKTIEVRKNWEQTVSIVF